MLGSEAMATKSSQHRTGRHRSATIQWIAIAIVIGLGILAAFVLLGEGPGGRGGQLGSSAPASVTASP